MLLPWLRADDERARVAMVAVMVVLMWRYMVWRWMVTLPPPGPTLDFGVGLIFAWAAVWHGVKFGVLTGVQAIDRKTATYRVPTRVED